MLVDQSFILEPHLLEKDAHEIFLLADGEKKNRLELSNVRLRQPGQSTLTPSRLFPVLEARKRIFWREKIIYRKVELSFLHTHTHSGGENEQRK